MRRIENAQESSGPGVPVLALVGFLVFWSQGQWDRVDGFLVLSGLVLIVLANGLPSFARIRVGSRHVLALAAVAFTIFQQLLPSPLMDLASVRAGTILAGAVIAAAWLTSRPGTPVHVRVWVASIAALGFGLIALLSPPPSIDIYRVHLQAGHLAIQGADPYLALRVPIDPELPEQVVVGYPYPPISLLAYGIGSTIADPRLVSILSLLAFVTITAMRWAHDPARWWLLIYALIAPTLVPLVVGTFTEALAGALLVATLVFYQRRPSAFTAFLHGAALSSKQHLVVGALGTSLSFRNLRKASWYGIGVATSLASGLLISPGGYLAAVVASPAGLDPNPQSASLYGLTGFQTPIILAIAIAAGVGAIVGWRQRSPNLRPLIWSLAFFLFLGNNSIWSHWMLVGWLATFEGLGVGPHDEPANLGYPTNSLRNLPV